VGKLADIALWRLDGLEGAGIDDPVSALVFGATDTAELLLVGGRPVVEDGALRTADEAQVAVELARESRRLAERAEARV
jgi:cytosine/adenosine deaminase-related metal-dependent hydrolase